MNNIENNIIGNISSLIMMLRSQGKKQLSIAKFLLFINKNYNIQLDQEALEDILNQNKSVVELEGDKIIIGEPKKDDEDKEASDDVHDMAVDQAADNMSMESVNYKNIFPLYENIHIGDTINPSSIHLDNSDVNYFVNQGVKKAHTDYIVIDILPQKTIQESKVRCKINGQQLIIDLPISSIIL